MDGEELWREGVSEKKSISPSIPLLIFGTVMSSLAIGISVLSIPFTFPFFRKICLPYVPATTSQVENVLRALNNRSGKVIDLGSGDGRLVIASAKRGFQSTGVELNPWLVAYSKFAAYREGVHKRVKFFRRDLWKMNLRPYENVIIFGVETMYNHSKGIKSWFVLSVIENDIVRNFKNSQPSQWMDDLERKFIKELDENTYIVACRFPLKNLKPVQVFGSGIDTVWLYKVK